MPLQTIIQLHILLAMTPALAGWMIATPANPIIARAYGSACQVRYVLTEPIGGDQHEEKTARLVSGSVLAYCSRQLQRSSCHIAAVRPSQIALPLSSITLSPLVRAP